MIKVFKLQEGNEMKAKTILKILDAVHSDKQVFFDYDLEELGADNEFMTHVEEYVECQLTADTPNSRSGCAAIDLLYALAAFVEADLPSSIGSKPNVRLQQMADAIRRHLKTASVK